MSDKAIQLAAEFAPQLAEMSPEERAGLLDAVAGALDEHAGELIPLADGETNLGEARLTGELRRTTFQLRLFADEVRTGRCYDARIDTAAQDWPTGPRPDLRRYRIPLGPAAVFAASNFPFAFSVAGGDTASAWAAGCPVIVKAHPGHPELSLRTAEIVSAVLPHGMFALVEGVQTGVDLLRHKDIAAGAFTGSVRGGLALAGVAAERDVPIPFYGELGSVNPVIVTPGAAIRAELAADYVASLTAGAGQFCTNPGLLFCPASSELPEQIARLLAGVPATPMLNERIAAGFRASATALDEHGVLERLVWQEDPLAPRLLATDLDTLAAHVDWAAQECFGPLAVIVRYRDLADVPAAIAALPGQLTTSVHADDAEDLGQLPRALVARSGRVLWNQWPTGVSVTPAMQHGGPFPATTAPQTTSVGTAALDRFTRPVAYQNWPQHRLPEPLRDNNPWQIPQRRT